VVTRLNPDPSGLGSRVRDNSARRGAAFPRGCKRDRLVARAHAILLPRVAFFTIARAGRGLERDTPDCRN